MLDNACGNVLSNVDGRYVCEACGNVYEEVEKISEEEVIALNHATTLRKRWLFDDAWEEYDLILKKYPENESASWGALICEYGIIYETDYDGSRKINCHRLSEKPIDENAYYAKLNEEHKAEAEKIEALRLSILEKSKKIQPYDVFICYKQTDERFGRPTREAAWARDLYELLTHKMGLRVFYAEKALAQVEVVEGEPFCVELLPAKTGYKTGETVTISWTINSNYFSADSRLRITLSDDYGKTFNHVLAEEVAAFEGEYAVVMPDVTIGQVDVDFATATRKMNGGVIKIEEIDGPAFTLTVLDPNKGNGFTITEDATCIDRSEFTQNPEFIFDLQGRRVVNPTKGIYIVNGKKVIK